MGGLERFSEVLQRFIMGFGGPEFVIWGFWFCDLVELGVWIISYMHGFSNCPRLGFELRCHALFSFGFRVYRNC